MASTQQSVRLGCSRQAQEISCASWKIPGYSAGQFCGLDALVTQTAKGEHPSDGSLPLDAVLMELFGEGTSVSALDVVGSIPGSH